MAANPSEQSAPISAVLEEVRPVAGEEVKRNVLVENNRDFHWITDKVCGIVEEKTPTWWWVLFGLSLVIASYTFLGIAYQVATGVGTWGNNAPVFWGWPIVNFVFWIGIGHAGTLISAILALLKQKWRTAVNRTEEAMTICAVC